MTTKTTTGRRGQNGRHLEARRQAVRAARAIMLKTGGVNGVTIAEVAKALRFTSPALYRYFPDGRDELLRAVHHAALEDLGEQMIVARERQPKDDIAARLYASTRAVFHWSLAHPGEFSLLMGPDFHLIRETSEQSDRDVAEVVGGAYLPTFVALMRQTPAGMWPSDDEVPADMREQILEHTSTIAPGMDVPLGLGYTWIVNWRNIFGVICMASFQHLSFAYGDFEQNFEDMMAHALRMYGLELSDRFVEPPGTSGVQRDR